MKMSANIPYLTYQCFLSSILEISVLGVSHFGAQMYMNQYSRYNSQYLLLFLKY